MNVGSVSGSAAMLRPSGPPPAGAQQSMQKAMEGTAKLLGLSTDDLQTQLKSGKTLNDLASEKGVSHDDLIASIEQGMKAAAPQGVQAPAGFDSSRMAEDIAAGKGPGGPPPGSRGAGGGQDDKLSSLASALGTDVSSLLEQLQSGDISSLLNSSNPYAKTAGLSTSGLRADTYA